MRNQFLREFVLRFMEEEGLHKSAAVRRILKIDLNEWKKRRAIDLYRDGMVTSGKPPDRRFTTRKDA